MVMWNQWIFINCFTTIISMCWPHLALILIFVPLKSKKKIKITKSISSREESLNSRLWGHSAGAQSHVAYSRASIRFPVLYIPPGKSDSLRSKHRQDRGKHGSMLSKYLLETVNKLTIGLQVLFIQPCEWLLVTYSASGVSNMSLRKPTHDTLGAMDQICYVSLGTYMYVCV